MGNKASSMLQDEEISEISEETGFSANQVEQLYSRFKSLDVSETGSLSRSDFLRVPELAINPLCDRIVDIFFYDCDEDHDRINFLQFMKVLATFRSSSHKLIPSRKASRLEVIQDIWNSLSEPGKFRQSRNSSCDGFFNHHHSNHHHHHHHQHHLTNQHNIHYVASSTHLGPSSHHLHGSLAGNGHHLYGHHHHNTTNTHNQLSPGHHQNNNNTASNNNTIHHLWHTNGHAGGGNSMLKPSSSGSSLLDPDEPANSRKQKLFFMFKIYDVDRDDQISAEDLKKILKMMVGNYISEQELVGIAEKTMQQVDKNCDGVIDFDEFCAAFLHRDIDELLRVRFSN